MRSLKFKVEPGDEFFSKSETEHRQTVAEATGLDEHLVEVRYLTLDTGAHEAIIFYTYQAEVIEVYPGTPEWEASEIVLERQRREGG